MIDWRTELERNACGSHVPVLALVALLFPIRCAVEFGLGRNSTRAFLDRRLFPDLERLVSYEELPQWIDATRRLVGVDLRWTPHPARLVGGVYESERVHVAHFFFSGLGVGADLVLVDNSSDGRRRRTVVETLRARRFGGLILLHDAERKDLREVTKGALVLTPVRGLPATAVFGPSEAVDRIGSAARTSDWAGLLPGGST